VYDEGCRDECQGENAVMTGLLINRVAGAGDYQSDAETRVIVVSPLSLCGVYSSLFRCVPGHYHLMRQDWPRWFETYIKVMNAFPNPSFILRRLNSMLATPYPYMRLTAMRDLPRSRFTSGGSALR